MISERQVAVLRLGIFEGRTVLFSVRPVGKRTLRVLCVLGASAVSWFFGQIHRRDAEPAEITQRKTIFPTDSEGRTTNSESQSR